jgi:hypothetical protein
MNVVRAKAEKIDGSAAEAALIALVRLVARQAAREWAGDDGCTDASGTYSLPAEPRS